MEVQEREEVKEYVVFSTETHIFKIGKESLQQTLDGKKPKIAFYKKLAGIRPQSDTTSGLEYQDARDSIYREIMKEEPPYTLEGQQLVLAEFMKEKESEEEVEEETEAATEEPEAADA